MNLAEMGKRTSVQQKFETLIASLDDMLDNRVAARNRQHSNHEVMRHRCTPCCAFILVYYVTLLNF